MFQHIEITLIFANSSKSSSNENLATFQIGTVTYRRFYFVHCCFLSYILVFKFLIETIAMHYIWNMNQVCFHVQLSIVDEFV